MILCDDESLYTGISNDVDKRYSQHVEKKGAKYFRGRQPKKLVYLESGHTRSTASRRENEIKKLKKPEKMLLINASSNELSDA